jgi:hypothetical protein
MLVCTLSLSFLVAITPVFALGFATWGLGTYISYSGNPNQVSMKATIPSYPTWPIVGTNWAGAVLSVWTEDHGLQIGVDACVDATNYHHLEIVTNVWGLVDGDWDLEKTPTVTYIHAFAAPGDEVTLKVYNAAGIWYFYYSVGSHSGVVDYFDDTYTTLVSGLIVPIAIMESNDYSAANTASMKIYSIELGFPDGTTQEPEKGRVYYGGSIMLLDAVGDSSACGAVAFDPPPIGMGIEGRDQNNALSSNEFNVGSGFTQIPEHTALWSGVSEKLTLENVKTWATISNVRTSGTVINSVVSDDLDGDGQAEIVTGGCYDNTTPISTGSLVAQLCVWDGATMTLENVRTWFWTSSTSITSVAVSDVDGDGKQEIVTGGWYDDGARTVAQLCVWDGATLAFENVAVWYWTDSTSINSVAVGDVDDDGQQEIVTGGYFNDGTRLNAQLVVWSGVSLALENVRTWHWASPTIINSVAVGDVDDDAQLEIVTGGYYWGEMGEDAQLCVWDGASLSCEGVATWHSGGAIYTAIIFVAVGDVDSDGETEILTGGYYTYFVHLHDVASAQLCIWA